jgi:hypothetical protein
MKKVGLNQSQQTCFYLFKIILFIFLSLIIYKKTTFKLSPKVRNYLL